MPSELLDYVVVHELAHRKEMNHSPRFWAVVEKELPDYRERREKLKKMGKLKIGLKVSLTNISMNLQKY